MSQMLLYDYQCATCGARRIEYSTYADRDLQWPCLDIKCKGIASRIMPAPFGYVKGRADGKDGNRT
jgi:hypothetical protein